MKKTIIRFIAIALAILTSFQGFDMGLISAIAADYRDGDDYPEDGDYYIEEYNDNDYGYENNNDGDDNSNDYYELSPSTSIVYFEDAYNTSLGQGTRVNISNRSNKTVDLAWTQSGSDVFNVSAPYLTGISPMDYSSFSISVNDYLPAGNYSGSLTVWITEDLSLQSAVTVRFYIDVYEEKHDPVVTEVTIVPETVTLTPKDTYSFYSSVYGSYIEDYSVKYSISGQTSDNTYITSDGTLVVAGKEKSSTIYVKAASSVNPNVSATAVVSIKPNTYQIGVQANPAEGGVVTGGNIYNKGTTATLNASANNGYVFTGWTLNGNDVANTNQYNVKVNASGTYVANFKKVNVYVLLDVNPSTECGTITSSNYVSYGGDMNINATPAQGYKFVGWKENNTIISKDAQYKLKGLTGDRHITACFEKSRATIQLLPSINNAGTVEGSGTFDIGSKCTITAKPFEGYVFNGWFSNNQLVSTKSSYTINAVDKDYCFIAGFAKEDVVNYTIKASAPAVGGIISPSGSNIIPKGGSVTYIITAAQGYKISSVLVDGKNVGSVVNYTFSDVKGDHKIEVTFEKQASIPDSSSSPAKPQDNAKPAEPATDNNKPADNNANQSDIDNTPSTTPDIPDADQLPADYIPGNNDIIDTSDTDYSLLTGILAIHDITREEASVLIDMGQAEQLFVEAYQHGYLQMTVNTDYAQNSQPTATGDFFNNPSIVNYSELMEKLFTKEELLDALEGTTVAINVDITNYSDDIPVFYKQVLAQMADGYKKQIDSYFDITLIKTNKYGSNLITDFEDVNGLFVIRVPRQYVGRDLSVIHYHVNEDGSLEKELLEDLDNNPDTITISVNKLSMFAIVEDHQHPVIVVIFKIIVIILVVATLTIISMFIYLSVRKSVRKKKHKKGKKAGHDHNGDNAHKEHTNHADHSRHEGHKEHGESDSHKRRHEHKETF